MFDLFDSILSVFGTQNGRAAVDREIEERARTWEADTLRGLRSVQKHAVLDALLLTVNHDGVVTGGERAALNQHLDELTTAAEGHGEAALHRYVTSANDAVRAALANDDATEAFIRRVGERLGDDAVRDLVFERVAALALRHAERRDHADVLLAQFAAGFRLGDRAARLRRYVESQSP